MLLEVLNMSFELWVFGRQWWAVCHILRRTDLTGVLVRRAVIRVNCACRSWEAVWLVGRPGWCLTPQGRAHGGVRGAFPLLSACLQGSPETAGNRSSDSCKIPHPVKAMEEIEQGSLLQPWLPGSPVTGTKKAPFLFKSWIWNESLWHSFRSSHWCGAVKHLQYGLSQLHFPSNIVVWFTPVLLNISQHVTSVWLSAVGLCVRLWGYTFLLHCILCLGFLSWDDFFSCFNTK